MNTTADLEEKTITLTLPVSVLEQVAQVAAETDSEIAQVLRSVVAHSFQTVYVHPQRAAMQVEEAVFRLLQQTLPVSLRNQFVAIHGGQVVDHDSDEDALLDRVQRDYPHKVVLVRHVAENQDKVLRIRSPRQARGVAR